MRLPALAVILFLTVLVPLSSDKTLAVGPRNPTPPRPPAMPHFTPWHNVPHYGVPRLPRNYRPGRNPGVRVVNVTASITFTFNADVGKVRTLTPPEQFDDKGNIKKLTREELKAAKGDDPAEKKLAGFRSDIAEVQVGDVVQVRLATHRKNGKTTRDKVDPDLDADKAPSGKDGKWVVVGQLLGTVTRVAGATTNGAPTLTVRVTGQVLVASNAGRSNTNQMQTVSPDKAQATLILIGRRPVGGSPAAGAGRKGKKS